MAGRTRGRSKRSDVLKCISPFGQDAKNAPRIRAVQLGPVSQNRFVRFTDMRISPPALRRKRKSDVSLGSSVSSRSLGEPDTI